MPRPASSKTSIANCRTATGFDDMEAPIPGRDDYRVLVAAGMLVPAFAVVGQLVSDGAVELLQSEIDFEVD